MAAVSRECSHSPFTQNFFSLSELSKEDWQNKRIQKLLKVLEERVYIIHNTERVRGPNGTSWPALISPTQLDAAPSDESIPLEVYLKKLAGFEPAAQKTTELALERLRAQDDEKEDGMRQIRDFLKGPRVDLSHLLEEPPSYDAPSAENPAPGACQDFFALAELMDGDRNDPEIEALLLRLVQNGFQISKKERVIGSYGNWPRLFYPGRLQIAAASHSLTLLNYLKELERMNVRAEVNSCHAFMDLTEGAVEDTDDCKSDDLDADMRSSNIDQFFENASESIQIQRDDLLRDLLKQAFDRGYRIGKGSISNANRTEHWPCLVNSDKAEVEDSLFSGTLLDYLLMITGSYLERSAKPTWDKSYRQ